jgi:hypothetical protein
VTDETGRMDRRVPLALGIDVFSVTLFVAVGRREHDRDSAIAGLITTAAPFLIALAVAWLVLRVWQRPTDWRIGVGICVITVGAGMVLRNVVFGDGTATSFVVVTTLFLTLFLVGWRLAYALVERRSQPAHSAR